MGARASEGTFDLRVNGSAGCRFNGAGLGRFLLDRWRSALRAPVIV